jgi:L-iditol 2-dehydrogenase
MKALVYRRQDDAALEERQTPSPGPEEALVRMRRVGICHSDIVLLEGDYTIPVTYPVVPGHEWAGEVVEVGRSVSEVQPGDHVVGEVVVGQHGAHHFGFTIDGAASEYFTVRAEWLHRVPDSLSWAQAALVEPFSIAYNATVALGGVFPGDVVAVFGAGPIGLLSVLAVRANGGRAVVIEPSESRRERGSALGASAALDPRAPDAADRIAEATAGRGFDGIIEASGSPNAMAQALEVAADGGRIAYVGINVAANPAARMGMIQQKSLRIQGAVGSAGLWPRVIRLLASGVVDPTPIVTATYPLSRALEALDAAHDTASQIKVHITADDA